MPSLLDIEPEMIPSTLEIGMRNAFPEILSLHHIIQGKMGRGEDYQEVNDRVPDELKEFTTLGDEMLFAPSEDLMWPMLDIQTSSEDQINIRAAEIANKKLDDYIKSTGPDSIKLARAIADPSLIRVDQISRNLDHIINIYANSDQEDLKLGVISQYDSLKGLNGYILFDRRIEYLKDILTKNGTSIEEFINGKSHVKNSELNIRNLEKRMEAEFEVSNNFITGGVPKIIRSEFDKAETDLAFDRFYFGCMSPIELSGLFGLINNKLEIEFDGKVEQISPLQYIDNVQNHLTYLKRIKNYLINTALKDGIDHANKQTTVNKAINLAYENKSRYLQENKRTNRETIALMLEHKYGRPLTITELKNSKIYNQVYQRDREIESNADIIF